MKKMEPSREPSKRPDSKDSTNTRLEIAKQNKKLAEVRYKTSVRRGRAWSVSRADEKGASKPKMKSL
jgi:ribosomal protein L13E